VTEVLRILFYLVLGVPASIFGVYAIVILYYGRNSRKDIKNPDEKYVGPKFEPLVSVVVPTHNEEMIISKKIENLLSCSYPLSKVEMIFVDDSDDSTREIIRKHAGENPNIRLLEFEQRMGYSPSMIAGCKAAKGEIIVLNDAASFLDFDAISNMVSRFENPAIGVVTGKDVILNVNEEVGRSEGLYQRLYNYLRASETNMDSTFYIKGEATAVRSVLLEDLQTSTETFDTTVGLVARQKGYKTVYDPNVSFYEYAPKTRTGRVKQKTIRAANLIKVLWRFRYMMFKRKYGKYGSLVLPINFAMLVLVPIMVLVWITLLVLLTLFDLGFALIAWYALGVVSLPALVLSRHLVFTFFEFEYSLLKAIYQVVYTRKTHDKIDKEASTRRLP
jgi:cellulose synthase/poly-beta-1,6-N-acetylglucosamine synthase-like glycosyltransferase